jgi:hypothetical protein
MGRVRLTNMLDSMQRHYYQRNIQHRPLGRDGKAEKYSHSAFLYIPIRFLVGRNETSSTIMGDRAFALGYYVDWLFLSLNVSHHSKRIARNADVVIEWAAFSFCDSLISVELPDWNLLDLMIHFIDQSE